MRQKSLTRSEKIEKWNILKNRVFKKLLTLPGFDKEKVQQCLKQCEIVMKTSNSLQAYLTDAEHASIDSFVMEACALMKLKHT